MDPGAVVAARDYLLRTLGQSLASAWLETYRRCANTRADYQLDAQSTGKRALKNLALGYLLAGGHPESERMAANQYYNATNMTDRMGGDRKSTRLNSSHSCASRMPSSA